MIADTCYLVTLLDLTYPIFLSLDWAIHWSVTPAIVASWITHHSGLDHNLTEISSINFLSYFSQQTDYYCLTNSWILLSLGQQKSYYTFYLTNSWSFYLCTSNEALYLNFFKPPMYSKFNFQMQFFFGTATYRLRSSSHPGWGQVPINRGEFCRLFRNPEVYENLLKSRPSI